MLPEAGTELRLSRCFDKKKIVKTHTSNALRSNASIALISPARGEFLLYEAGAVVVLSTLSSRSSTLRFCAFNKSSSPSIALRRDSNGSEIVKISCALRFDDLISDKSEGGNERERFQLTENQLLPFSSASAVASLRLEYPQIRIPHHSLCIVDMDKNRSHRNELFRNADRVNFESDTIG